MNDKQNSKTQEEFPETFRTLRKILSSNNGSGRSTRQDVPVGARSNTDQTGGNNKQYNSTIVRTENGGKRTNRQRNKFYTNRRGRSNNKMGTRRPNTNGDRILSKRSGGLGNKSNTVKKITNNLKNQRNETIGVTRRTGYLKPMEMKAPEITNEGQDGVRIVGSEFLGFVDVRTTDNVTSFSQPGSVVRLIPLNPLLLSGTRVAQLASMFQKYLWLDMTIEFVPSVPSTQDGAFIMFFVYDPNENFTVTTSSTDELMRLAIAHQGANMFNVYDYGRTSLILHPDSLSSYFVDDGSNARQEMQAYFVMMAASTFSREGASVLTAGSLVMHYHIRLMTRNLTEPLSLELSGQFAFNDGVTEVQDWFLTANGNIDSDNPAYMRSTLFDGQITKSYIIVLYVNDILGIGGQPYEVYDQHGTYTLYDKGSAWFLRPIHDGSDAEYYIYTTFESALESDFEATAVRWSTSFLGTLFVTSGNFNYRAIPLSIA